MPKLVAVGLTKQEFLKQCSSTQEEGCLVDKKPNSDKGKSPSKKVGNKESKNKVVEDGPTKETPPPAPVVPFSALFRFASNWDIVVTATGCFFALIQGMFMPCFALLMGEMIDTFAEDDGSSNSGLVDVRQLGVGFVILGVIGKSSLFA
jgi:hypothetical protein